MAFQEFTGREYLKIDVASNFGLDKAKWEERISWFDTHEDHLEDMIQQAKEPALYYAGVKAWRDVCLGKLIGYMISLDATSSGLQLLAVLTSDRSASEICNVIDTGKRMNAYTTVYHEMLDQLGEESQIDADKCKNAVMTALYSSKAIPKEVFGEGAMLDTFYETLNKLAPGAWDLNEAFLSMWDPKAYSHDWILPDNYHVHIKVMGRTKETVHFLNAPYDVYYNINRPMQDGRSLGANTVHSIDGMIVREMTRRCDYDPTKIERINQMIEIDWDGQDIETEDDRMVVRLWAHFKASGYLSARILDHLSPDNVGHVNKQDIRNLVNSLPKKPFKVVSIHDCFRCLPHYGNDLRRQYNLQLQLIAKSELLSYLTSQILNRPVSMGKLDPGLYMDIAQTNYALS